MGTNQFCNISDDDGPCVALQFRLCLIKSHHTWASVRDCHCHCHLSSSTQHKSDRPFLASSLVSYWKAQLPHHRQPVHRPTNQPLDAKTKAHENGTGQDRTGRPRRGEAHQHPSPSCIFGRPLLFTTFRLQQISRLLHPRSLFVHSTLIL